MAVSGVDDPVFAVGEPQAVVVDERELPSRHAAEQRPTRPSIKAAGVSAESQIAPR